MMKTTLVVMAAGIGSRFGGIKQMEGVGPNGETILEYALFDAERAGFDEAVFIIRKEMRADFQTAVLDHVKSGISLKLAFQETDCLPAAWTENPGAAGRKKPWGTAHAVWCAREGIVSPFAVINADDFYGARSYALLYQFLSRCDPEKDEYATVGYELGKTLSENGTVSRGVCKVDDSGCLSGIVEHTRLEKSGNGEVVSSGDGSPGSRTLLPMTTTVSMNMFGFSPGIFGHIDSLLDKFLLKNSADPKAEFYLPAAVQNLIDAGKASVRVLRSPENWFGVTYREDLEIVRGRIRELVAGGVYPASLRAPR